MKRFLLFLLLLGLGFLGLKYAIGTDDAVRAKTSDTTSDTPRPRNTGVLLQQGKIGASVSQTGPIEFPQYRTIEVGDGTTRHEQVFRLTARDSQPLNDSLQQLDDVVVLLYEADQASAKLVARQAFVELSRDASGKVSLSEQKDIDLRDAVFESLPGSRVSGLRLDLGNARIKVDDDELLINTATDFDPVTLVVAGARSGTLRGNGLQARLPRSRSSAMQHIDVDVLHDPVLETAGVKVRATGRMHYTEDLVSGAAFVSLDDDVYLDLGGSGLQVPGRLTTSAGTAAVSEIRGDQFTGWLMRRKRTVTGQKREDVAWRRLLLTGAPASVTLGKDRLLTPRITVLPGPLGEPFLVTAHGGESRIELGELQSGPKPLDPIFGTSPRRIHLVNPGNSIGALHRQLGFPQWSLRPLNEMQVVVFEGNAHLESGTRTVTASRGLHVFHRNGVEQGVAIGFGEVRLVQRADKPGQQDLMATGNDGCHALLTATRERWRLGPPMPAFDDLASPRWQAHRYEVTHGAAHARGTGACELERIGDRTVLRLRAPQPSIAGRLASRGVDLDGVNRLEAVLVGQEVVSLEAAGLPARATRTKDGDVVTAVAPRLQQIGPRSLRLLSAPREDPEHVWTNLPHELARPTLARTMAATKARPGMEVQVEGPQIDAHHLGLDDVLVDAVAVGDWLPLVTAVLHGKNDAPPTRTSFAANRLRALPFAMTREARLMHAAGSKGPLADLPFHSLGHLWLIADGVRDFRLDDPRYGLVQGRGRQLLLSQGAEAGLFVGDPDSLEPAEVSRTHEGRTVTTSGARVRVFRDEALELHALRTFADRPTFLLPQVTLHDPRSTGLLAHMTASCQGNIEVLPDSVLFTGPVNARSVRADGGEDPFGMNIDARSLRMERNRASGEIVRLLGREVSLDWSQVKAHSAGIEVDLRRSRLIARDPNGATIVLPDQRTYSAPNIELNYETMAVTSSNGRLQQGGLAEVRQR